jgi:hypothetical protein
LLVERIKGALDHFAIRLDDPHSRAFGMGI